MKSRHSINSSIVFLLCFYSISIVFLLLPLEAQAGLILQRPLYIGLTSGLVGYWSFDGPDMAGNTAYDRSGQGNNGTLTNGPVRKIGRIGQGLFVSGNNEVDINNSSTLSGMPALTVAAWIKLDQNTTDGAAFFNKRHSVSPWNSYLVSFTKPFLRYEVQVTNASGGVNPFVGSENNSVVYNQWQHVVMVYDGANVFMYIDGVQSGSTGALTGNVFTSDDKLYIMGSPAATGAVMGGDEFRIYNRALSPDEIKRLYKIGSTLLVNKPAYTDSLQNGLVGFWSFDGPDMAGNTAYDRSGNANNGTLTNGPVRKIGRIGQALEFDGVDDAIQVTQGSSINDLNLMTLSGWIYIKSFGENGFGRILDKTNGGFNWFLSEPNYFEFAAERWTTDGAWQALTASLVAYRWYHLAVTYDYGSTSNVPVFYVDGVQVTASQQAAPGGSLNSESLNLFVGNNSAGTRAFDGLIDDVRIYNRALSPDEIKRLYKIGSTLLLNKPAYTDSLQNGLVGFWSFDGPDMAGNTAYDRSGQGNNGTLTNGPVRKIGRIGQALEFDGVNDYVTIASNWPLTTGLTVTAWMMKTRNVSWSQSIVQRTGATFAWNIGQSCSSERWGGLIRINPTTYCVSTTFPPLLNTWYFHVLRWESGDYLRHDIYNVDGTVAARLISASTITGDLNDATAMDIGASAGESSYSPVRIDDVRVYNRALSPDEIKRLYNMGR